jgi:cell division GTPase FtsZ
LQKRLTAAEARIRELEEVPMDYKHWWLEEKAQREMAEDRIKELSEALRQALARIREAICDEVTENNHTVDLRNVLKQGEAALLSKSEEVT